MMSGIIDTEYVPGYRIKTQDIGIPWGSFGMGEKAVCGWDEDIISMAAEAVDNAVKHSGVKAADIGALYMGTASSHMVEMHLSPILAELQGLSPQASVLDLTGSVNAVGTALSQCMMAIEAKRIKCGIVVGTENRMVGPGSDAEVSFGAAAVAMVIGTEGTIADIEGVVIRTRSWTGGETSRIPEATSLTSASTGTTGMRSTSERPPRHSWPRSTRRRLTTSWPYFRR
jgi:3-hydroxy-3-methylglutaryl CoA synthase